MYGCNGPGGLHYPEFGLRWVGKQVDSGVTRIYEANAVLAVADLDVLVDAVVAPGQHAGAATADQL
jgi:hypothetical protein